jgi:hypothetical protein
LIRAVSPKSTNASTTGPGPPEAPTDRGGRRERRRVVAERIGPRGVVPKRIVVEVRRNRRVVFVRNERHCEVSERTDSGRLLGLRSDGRRRNHRGRLLGNRGSNEVTAGESYAVGIRVV